MRYHRRPMPTERFARPHQLGGKSFADRKEEGYTS